MGKRRDPGAAGRMLFTDFDASEKGRPLPPPLADTRRDGRNDAAGGRFPGRPMQTMEDIASSLDFDFEDDAGEAGDEPESGSAAGFFDADTEYIPGGEGKDEKPARPAADFSRRRRRPLRAPPPPRRREEDFAEPPAWREPAEPYPAEPIDDEADAVFRALPPLPERDVAADVDESDILSALPAYEVDEGEGMHRPYAGEWRGHRLGVEPPRARPYGGIRRIEEWYRPPEEAGDGPDAVQPIPDLYEPPEEPDQGRLFPEPPDAYPEREPVASREEERRPPGEFARHETTNVINPGSEIFGDVDLEAIWEEKRHRAGAEADGVARSESASPRPSASGRVDFRPEPPAPSAATTVIFNPDILDGFPAPKPSGGGTRAGRRGAFPSDGTIAERREKSGTTTIRTAPDTGGIGFLDDADGDSAGDGGAPPRSGGDGTAEAGTPEGMDEVPAPAESDAAAASPELDLDALIDAADAEAEADAAAERTGGLSAEELLDSLDYDDVPVVDENIKAPVIDDSAIDSLKAVRALAAEPELEPAPEDIQPDMADAISADGGDAIEAAVGEAGGAAEKEKAAAVNPADVFSNLDNMNFSDGGLDDEMQAMLKDDAAEASAADGADGAEPAVPSQPPSGLKGRIVSVAARLMGKRGGEPFLARLKRMIAWRENWWFYCDLLAALIASASMAILVSYFIWYRK